MFSNFRVVREHVAVSPLEELEELDAGRLDLRQGPLVLDLEAELQCTFRIEQSGIGHGLAGGLFPCDSAWSSRSRAATEAIDREQRSPASRGI